MRGMMVPRPVRHRPVRHRRAPIAVGTTLALGLGVSLAPPALAPGADALLAPVPSGALLGWAFDPLVALPLLLVGGASLLAVRRVDRAHPGNPVPRSRVLAFVAGLAAIEIALQSI